MAIKSTHDADLLYEKSLLIDLSLFILLKRSQVFLLLEICTCSYNQNELFTFSKLDTETKTHFPVTESLFEQF